MPARQVAGFLALLLVAPLACSHYNLPESRGAEVGVLTCETVPGTSSSVLISSRVELDCRFRSPGGEEEPYAGEAGISLGLDLAWQRDEVIRFAVLSAVRNHDPGFLAGRFVGASASATLGVGLGVGTLVGGGEDQLTLQPVGLSTGSGLGLSVGLSYLVLESR